MSWQKILAQGFASSSELLHYLGLHDFSSKKAEQFFSTRVPLGFANRMGKNNPQDPLLLQVLALPLELENNQAFSPDPLEELHANPIQGLLHKYHGRVLVTLTGACAINCRYCFRRHFPYQENNPGRENWHKITNYISEDNSIHELIFSGGDPLLVGDQRWQTILASLEQIPHLQTIRFHTRVPVVLPERINDEFVALFKNQKRQKVMVLHCNHPNEINEEVRSACLKLTQAGFVLLNQSVLLKNINNQAEILATLSKKLFQCGVLPYYLHLLDKVEGATHFDLPHEEARQIFKKLQSLLPGYLVPRLAREEPGQTSKTLIS